jgi:hypothetical protein
LLPLLRSAEARLTPLEFSAERGLPGPEVPLSLGSFLICHEVHGELLGPLRGLCLALGEVLLLSSTGVVETLLALVLCDLFVLEGPSLA